MALSINLRMDYHKSATNRCANTDSLIAGSYGDSIGNIGCYLLRARCTNVRGPILTLLVPHAVRNAVYILITVNKG